jgi:O-antigen ligase
MLAECGERNRLTKNLKITNNEHVSSGSINTRLLILNFAAISVSLGTAVSAAGRLALYVLALWIVLTSLFRDRSTVHWPESPWPERWQIIILITVAYMALSLLWTSADLAKALGSWTRHARLLVIPLLWILIRNTSEARLLLRVFVLAQLFVVLSSWMLVCELQVPWATASDAKTTFAVFGSYLEQSISESIMVFILWHQRNWIFGKNGKLLAMIAALITTVHILGFLAGRSGHLVFMALASIAVIWQLPQKQRWLAVIIPFVIAILILAGFKTVRERILLVEHEVSAYSQRADSNSSSGLRLLYWQTSLQSVVQKPVLGSGAGGWNSEFRRLSAGKLPPDYYTVDNPHQMFLLWAVEGGLVGLLLLCSVLVSIYLHSKSLPLSDARSLQSVLIALAVAGFTTSTIYGIGMGDYFCVAIGILLCTAKESLCNQNQEPEISR